MRHLDPGAQHRIVDHHHRHGGPRDDLEIMPGPVCDGHQIKPDVGVEHRLDPGLRNADQHDRFRVLDQLGADHMGGGIKRHQHVDRFAGIAGGADEIAGDESPADGLPALQHRGDRHIAAHRAIAVGPRHQRARGNLGQKLGQKNLGAQGGGQQRQHRSGNKGKQQMVKACGGLTHGIMAKGRAGGPGGVHQFRLSTGEDRARRPAAGAGSG